MTPFASVAMLEKLALLKIARCSAPALSSTSSACLRKVMSPTLSETLILALVASFPLAIVLPPVTDARCRGPRRRSDMVAAPDSSASRCFVESGFFRAILICTSAIPVTPKSGKSRLPYFYSTLPYVVRSVSHRRGPIFQRNQGSPPTPQCYDQQSPALATRVPMAGSCVRQGHGRNFFASLKCKLIDRRNFKNRTEATAASDRARAQPESSLRTVKYISA